MAHKEHLLAHDKGGILQPEIATRWEVNDPGKQFTFYLRDNVPFHFNWGNAQAKDAALGVFFHTLPDSITSRAKVFRQTKTEAIDDRTLRVTLLEGLADPDFLEFFANSFDVFVESTAQWDKEGKAGLARKPTGTGPYQYVSRSIGTGALFERVPYKHWRITPDFVEVEYKWAAETATRLAQLLAGEAHIAQLPTDLEKRAVASGMRVVASGFPNNSLALIIGGGYSMLPDLYDPTLPTNNVKVREAINRAINRKELLDTFFPGKATTMPNHLFYTNTPGYNPDWLTNFEANYGYDPARAAELIKEAGYPNGVKIKIWQYSSYPQTPEIPQITEALPTYLKAANIDAELEVVDFATVRGRWRAKKTDGYLYGLPSSWRPIQGNLHNYYNSTPGNVHGYHHPDVQAAYDELLVTLDATKRAQLIRTIGDHVYANYATIPIAQVFFSMTVNPGVVAEWEFTGIGLAQFGGNVENIVATR
jgi:ABC-type transport system substrate-binding protein